MTWGTDGVKLLVDVSTDGAFISPPFRVDYPFVSAGSNVPPTGWTAYIPTGTVASDMSISTDTDGVTRIIATASNDEPYTGLGMERTFAVTPHHSYQFAVRVKAEPGRGQTTMPVISVQFFPTSGSSYIRTSNPFTTGMPDEANFYSMSVDNRTTSLTGDPVTSVKVTMYARVPTGAPNTAKWGALFTSFAITDTTAATAPSFSWHPVVCDTKEATLRFGRARFTERYDVGTFLVRLDNVEGDYMFSDSHPWGFRPGRMFRMRAEHNSITYPMCLGVIDRVKTEMSPDGKASVTVTAFDTTSYTSDIPTPQISFSSPGTINDPDSLSGNRVNALLNFAGVAESMRIIDPGIFGTQNVSESGRGLREEIGVTADSEGGSFYGERDGKLIYRDRSWSDRDPTGGTVQANITAYPRWVNIDLTEIDDVPTDPNAPIICPIEMDTDWSLERVINAITLAVAGSTRYKFDDQPSQTANGIHTYQRLDFVNRGGTSGSALGGSLATQMQLRASDIFSTSLNAMLRVQRLAYRPSGSNWIFTLTAFLNWLVRVVYYNDRGEWGFSTVVRIQSITHRITPEDWVTSIDVDQPIDFGDTVEPVAPGGWDSALWDINIWDETNDDFVPGEGTYWNSGQTWNGPEVYWMGRGWSSGIAEWSNPDDDWKP